VNFKSVVLAKSMLVGSLVLLLLACSATAAARAQGRNTDQRAGERADRLYAEEVWPGV
jgi:hypothetical protein